MKDVFEDENAVQNKKTCVQCGSNLGEDQFSCPNCGSTQYSIGNPHSFRPAKPGKQFNPYSNDPNSNPLPVYKGVVAFNDISIKKAKKQDLDEDEKDKEDEKDENGEIFVSEEFSQCFDQDELRKNYDKKEEIMKSCLDLEIDG